MPKRPTKDDVERWVKLVDERGYSYKKIGEEEGWAPDTIGKYCREYREKCSSRSGQASNQIETDAEVLELKKGLRKAELKRQIREQEKPFKLEERLDKIGLILSELIYYLDILGKYRQKYCKHFGEDEYCHFWEFDADVAGKVWKRDKPMKEGDIWRIKPTFWRCALCYAYTRNPYK